MRKTNLEKLVACAKKDDDGRYGDMLEKAIRHQLTLQGYGKIAPQGAIDIVSSVYGKIETKSGAGELAWIPFNMNITFEDMANAVMRSNDSEWFLYCQCPADYVKHPEQLLDNVWVCNRAQWLEYMQGGHKVLTNGKAGKFTSPIRWKKDSRGERITLQTPCTTQMDRLAEISGMTASEWIKRM